MRGKAAGLVLLLTALARPAILRTQEKPLTQDQVMGLVRNNLGDESGAKLVEQRGLDFQPSEEFLQTLRRAGASDAFLKAVRSARFKALSGPAASRPLSRFQLLALLAKEVPSQRVAILVEERGIDFKPADGFLEAVEMAGADQTLLQTLRRAQPVRALRPANTPAEEAAKAEQEFRAALEAEPEKPALHLFLGYALAQQQKLDEAMTEYREALRLNPSFVAARIYLGSALFRKGDVDGAIGEYREALRLNPKSAVAHTSLGNALAIKGDLAGAMAECRQALSLDPNNWAAHLELGSLMRRQGDIDGAAAEAREALRIDPDLAVAHFELGLALEAKRDRQSALEQYRLAADLAPDVGTYRQNYERISRLLHKPVLPAATSGPVYSVGGGVSAPVPVFTPNPPYSEQARHAKYQGTVVLWIVVDPQGNVADVRVTKSLGLGLDEKAVETVRTWKFKPALRNGVPVPVRLSLEVTFRLF